MSESLTFDADITEMMEELSVSSELAPLFKVVALGMEEAISTTFLSNAKVIAQREQLSESHYNRILQGADKITLQVSDVETFRKDVKDTIKDCAWTYVDTEDEFDEAMTLYEDMDPDKQKQFFYMMLGKKCTLPQLEAI